jgi:acyl transferase domain-containing protein
MTDQTTKTPSPTVRHHAFVFPGQGSQYVGMGTALLERSPEAQAIMERADAALGFSISRLIAEGPAEELELTINAQPAILATSIAYLEGPARRCPPGRGRARSCWPAIRRARRTTVAADAIDFETAMRLVREHGRIMQERGIDGGMGAVLGLTDEQVHASWTGPASTARSRWPTATRRARSSVGRHPRPEFALEMSRTVGAPGGAPDCQRGQPLTADASARTSSAASGARPIP